MQMECESIPATRDKQLNGSRILIAKLQLDYICGLKSDRAIKEALVKLPSGVYATYDEILRQLCAKRPDDVEDMKLILQLLLYSIVPLTLPEIAELLSIRPGDTVLDESGIATDLMDLAALLGSLATVHYTQQTFTGFFRLEGEDVLLRGPRLVFLSLAHYSVEEYLRSDQMDPTLAASFYLDSQSVHARLAKICLQYIGFEDFSELPRHKRSQLQGRTWCTPKYDFYHYACWYWADHLRLSVSADDLDDETTHLLGWLLKPCHLTKNYVSWQQKYHSDEVYYCPLRPPLYYSIEFQIHGLVSLLLGSYKTLDFLATGFAPLHVAARCGALAIVQRFLDLGASVNFRSIKDPSGMISLMTPLHFSAEEGHPDVTKLLLDNGANPHLKNESGSTPFSEAARSGSLKTLKLLYDAGSNINIQEKGVTPLFEALLQSRTRVACQLLHWGADYRLATLLHDSPVRFLQRTANSSKQIVLKPYHSDLYGDNEIRLGEPRKGGISEEDMCGQIEGIRKQGKGPEGFLPLMKTFRRKSFFPKNMEKDTRPGTERKKDYRISV
jgi:hypothetical protein